VITVRVGRAEDGSVISLHTEGHAGFADPGEDIVCAAVTALVVTALIGLKRVAAHPHEGRAGSGKAWCRLLPGGTPESLLKAQAILETTVLGLKDIEKDYKDYVRVTEGG